MRVTTFAELLGCQIIRRTEFLEEVRYIVIIKARSPEKEIGLVIQPLIRHSSQNCKRKTLYFSVTTIINTVLGKFLLVQLYVYLAKKCLGVRGVGEVFNNSSLPCSE